MSYIEIHCGDVLSSVIFIIEGSSRTLIGENGEITVDNKAGDFIFIPFHF